MYEKSPDILRVVAPPLNIQEGDVPEQSAKPQVAVFITHGMGQQVPFETLDAAAEGLMQAANRNGNNVKAIRARTVQIKGIKTQRAEFDMRDVQDREIEVHVYEGYWAPITEGQLTLRDVMSFLFNAGFKGLWNCRLPFERWLFNGPVQFGRQHWAALQLLAILAVLTSLVIINSVIAVVAASRMFHAECVTACAPTFSEPTFIALTGVAGLYAAACIVFGSSLGLLLWLKKWKRCPVIKSMWPYATQIVNIFVLLWASFTLIAGLVMLLLATGCIELNGPGFKCISKLWIPVWGGLLLASWYVKNLLVQYMGDVAAYVDSHSLVRFDSIRTRIKALVFEHAKAIYSIQNYERIAMMGHSLGSVITYDTLNALINHDALYGQKLDVIKRTKLLLTFGSPLDKTAFVFASQIDKATETREALSTTLQPLIQAYIPYRDFNWINVYSPRDIVSGKLDFYDDPKASGYTLRRGVKNVEDTDGKIPLAAHIEYWNNTTLFDELYANL